MIDAGTNMPLRIEMQLARADQSDRPLGRFQNRGKAPAHERESIGRRTVLDDEARLCHRVEHAFENGAHSRAAAHVVEGIDEMHIVRGQRMELAQPHAADVFKEVEIGVDAKAFIAPGRTPAAAWPAPADASAQSRGGMEAAAVLSASM